MRKKCLVKEVVEGKKVVFLKGILSKAEATRWAKGLANMYPGRTFIVEEVE